LICEFVAPARADRYSARAFAGQSAIAVKLDLVYPFATLRKALNRLSIHGLNEVDFRPRQIA
jgi:hypothetical protein